LHRERRILKRIPGPGFAAKRVKLFVALAWFCGTPYETQGGENIENR
jgi:hypothetical protein